MDPDPQREHRHFEDMAVAHVLGGLEPSEGQVFRAHLLECGDCRARVGELRAIAHELAGVERDERRVRAAKAVDMKSREGGDDGSERPPAGRSVLASRLLLFAGVGVLIALAAYAFVLRGTIAGLEQRLDDRLEASAALEHGSDLEVMYEARGVTGTAKVNDDDKLVVILEGLTDDQPYGLFLVDGQGEAARTVYRQHQRARNGKIFVLFRLRGNEDRLIVTEPESSFSTDPDGVTVFETAITSAGYRPPS